MSNTTPTPPTITTSKKYSWNWMDAGKALVVAVLSPIVPIVQASLAAGNLQLPWKVMGLTALSAAVAYLVKNFFTQSQTIITPPPASMEITPGPKQ